LACITEPFIFKSIPNHFQNNFQFLTKVITKNPRIYTFLPDKQKDNKEFILKVYQEEKKIKQYLSKEICEQLMAKENLKILKNFNSVFDGYDIYEIIESFLF